MTPWPWFEGPVKNWDGKFDPPDVHEEDGCEDCHRLHLEEIDAFPCKDCRRCKDELKEKMKRGQWCKVHGGVGMECELKDGELIYSGRCLECPGALKGLRT